MKRLSLWPVAIAAAGLAACGQDKVGSPPELERSESGAGEQRRRAPRARSDDATERWRASWAWYNEGAPYVAARRGHAFSRSYMQLFNGIAARSARATAPRSRRSPGPRPRAARSSRRWTAPPGEPQRVSRHHVGQPRPDHRRGRAERLLHDPWRRTPGASPPSSRTPPTRRSCTSRSAPAASGRRPTAAPPGRPSPSRSASLACGSLAMDPNNPSTLYLGLGDPFDGTGLGLVKSTDGGRDVVGAGLPRRVDADPAGDRGPGQLERRPRRHRRRPVPLHRRRRQVLAGEHRDRPGRQSARSGRSRRPAARASRSRSRRRPPPARARPTARPGTRRTTAPPGRAPRASPTPSGVGRAALANAPSRAPRSTPTPRIPLSSARHRSRRHAQVDRRRPDLDRARRHREEVHQRHEHRRQHAAQRTGLVQPGWSSSIRRTPSIVFFGGALTPRPDHRRRRHVLQGERLARRRRTSTPTCTPRPSTRPARCTSAPTAACSSRPTRRPARRRSRT